MKIVCISASNTFCKGENSTSTQVCKRIKNLAETMDSTLQVEIIPLMEQKIRFCMLCGDCYEVGSCPYDKDFNFVYEKLKEANISFWVVPHYSPIPAKLLAVFEKMNEILYANMLEIPQFQSPFINHRTAIIGHGGMTENSESLKYYHDHLITPIANSLKSFGFSVVGLNEEYPAGAAFGLKDDTCILPDERSIFPEIVHHWDLIESRIKPLIQKALVG